MMSPQRRYAFRRAALASLIFILPPVFFAADPGGAAELGLVPVTSIVVQGNHAADTQLIIRTLDMPIGRPATVERLRLGTRALWNLGLFSDLSVRVAPDSAGQKLIVELDEQPRVSTIDVTGNKKIGTEDLKGKFVMP